MSFMYNIPEPSDNNNSCVYNKVTITITISSIGPAGRAFLRWCECILITRFQQRGMSGLLKREHSRSKGRGAGESAAKRPRESTSDDDNVTISQATPDFAIANVEGVRLGYTTVCSRCFLFYLFILQTGVISCIIFKKTNKWTKTNVILVFRCIHVKLIKLQELYSYQIW